jgi:hypothetical protein
MRVFLYTIFAMLMLSGCVAPTAQPIPSFYMDKLREVESEQLAKDYWRLRRNPGLGPEAEAQLMLVLEERGVRPDRWPSIREGRIQIGMNILEMFAAWGPPSDRNRHVSQTRNFTQWVYGSYAYGGKPTFVYTEDGLITSWSD